MKSLVYLEILSEKVTLLASQHANPVFAETFLSYFVTFF